MSWQKQDVARAGQFILATQIDGVWIDPLGSVKADDLLSRVRQFARGWTVTSVDVDYAFFGFGGHTYVYGKAESDVSTQEINSQIRAAFDSFVTIASTDFTITVSDSLDAPIEKKSEWTGTLQLISIAVICVAVVYGIRQLKEIAE